MKILFGSDYIECKKSEKDNNIILIISTKDQNNSLKKITNIIELTMNEFKQLISEI